MSRIPSLFVLVGATALLACNESRVEESAVDTFRFETGEGVPTIEARIEDGSIEVIGSGANEVEVRVRRRARSLDPDIARRLLESIRVEAVQEGDRIRIRDLSPRRPRVSFGSETRTELTVRVPENANLDLRTEDGRLSIEGVRGTLVAETGDGRIHVARVSPNVTLRTEDGSIVGRDVSGAVDAVTEDGRIELDGSFDRVRLVTSDGSIRLLCRDGTAPTGNWTVRTSDGPVSLTLPKSISIDIEATTSDGRIENRLKGFDGTVSESRLRGRLGSGGPLLFVSTLDGRIELSEK